MDKDKSNPVDFGADSDLKAKVAAAKAKRVPVGGVPMPQMPRLDQPPQQQQRPPAQRILTPEERQQLEQRGQFHQGVGSAYAANQPGVNQLPTDENGKEQPIDPRLAPRPPGSGLRPETVEQLEAVAAANKNSDDAELARIGAEIEDLDDVFETNEFGERVRSLLGNKKRAAAIANRCPPLSFEDLLLYGSVQQRVPIIPGKFEPTFRSLQGEENLEILRMMGPVRGPEQYLLDTLSLYRLAAGLHAINSKVLPNHLNSKGDFDEEMFRAKCKVVLKMALPILADLSVNFGWFAARVQKLTVVDDIKSF